ncbi:MAG: hypothetical protein ACPGJS_13730 [Flammeovirgaceae bacterium]
MLLCIVLSCWQEYAHTQDSTKVGNWHLGSITLNSGETKRGHLIFKDEVLIKNNSLAWSQGIRYNNRNYSSYHVLQQAEVLFDDGEQQQIYGGNDLKAFSIIMDSLRPESTLYFATLPMPSSTRITNTRFFFQVIHDGNLSLLKRQSFIYKRAMENLDELPPLLERKKMIVTSNYYVFGEATKELTLMKRDKKAVFRMMENKKAAIKTFIRNEGLKLYRDDDLSKLFHYYDSLNRNP